jgi:hypothetical protein
MMGIAIALAIGAARIPPVDQCTRDRPFVQFRSELRRTVAKRDAEALLKVVADDVYASFGGYIGKKDFIELWKLGRNPRQSHVWQELGKALELGCAVAGDARVVPSFEIQLGGDRDPFETRIALPGAILRASPSDRSAAIARLNWQVLTVSEPWDGGAWVRVKLDDGRTGYVREGMARSVIGWRAAFHKRGGQWLMTSFVAGD